MAFGEFSSRETTLRNPKNFWATIPNERRFGYESNQDRTIRYARQELSQSVWPLIYKMMAEELTYRQLQVLKLYLAGLRQEQIGRQLGISQSTVSRTLFGIRRNGRVVGGIVKKIRRIVDGPNCPPEIQRALRTYATQRYDALASA